MPVPCSTQCGKNAVLKVQYAYAKYILFRPIAVYALLSNKSMWCQNIGHKYLRVG